jgi:hypothetical protein
MLGGAAVWPLTARAPAQALGIVLQRSRPADQSNLALQLQLCQFIAPTRCSLPLIQCSCAMRKKSDD